MSRCLVFAPQDKQTTQNQTPSENKQKKTIMLCFWFAQTKNQKAKTKNLAKTKN